MKAHQLEQTSKINKFNPKVDLKSALEWAANLGAVDVTLVLESTVNESFLFCYSFTDESSISFKDGKYSEYDDVGDD
jgi:hypothetical protein